MRRNLVERARAGDRDAFAGRSVAGLVRAKRGRRPKRAPLILLALIPVISACASSLVPSTLPAPSSSMLIGLPSPVTTPPSTAEPLSTTAPARIAEPSQTNGNELPECTRAVHPYGPVTTYHVPVLMYHRIEPASDRGRDLVNLVVDPKVFEAQLGALKARGWHTITSAELAATMRAECAVPPKTFVITFDDGHDDGYTYAFPILEKDGFVATFFVITGRVGRPHYLTWTEMAEMQDAGMEIGNHTVGHIDETTYGRARTDAQVFGAQRAIEVHLHRPPVSFAYPFGLMPANLVASVKASGIEVAYTTIRGARESLATAYALPRIRVQPTTVPANLAVFLNGYR